MNFTEHVKIREEKFGTVIFETLKEKVFVTNEIGKHILDLLQKEKPVENIIEILTDSYNAQLETILKDVTIFISQLKDNNILTQ